MKRIELLPFMIISGMMFFVSNGFSQKSATNRGTINSIVDSLARKGIVTRSNPEKPKVKLSHSQALVYLKEKYRTADWNNQEDPLRNAIGELIFIASHQHFDSLKKYLNSYPYDSIDVPFERFFKWDSLRVKIPVIIREGFKHQPDSVPRADTFAVRRSANSSGLVSDNHLQDSLKAYRKVKPEPTVILKDTIIMVASATLPEVLRYRNSQPFKVYRFPFQSDSLSTAIKALTDYITEGDSSLIKIRGISGPAVPVWLNSKSDMIERYWLRNEFADSVTLWIGSAGRDSLGLYLEEGIMFRRPVKQTNISNAHLNLKEINSGRLQNVNEIYVKPRMWKYHSESAFVLNQTYLKNWVRGGESSVSTAMDVTGYADYVNNKLNLHSNNFIRLKYGLIKQGQEKMKKFLDLLETNSKIDHKAFGKFDFSAVLLFKTQIAKGYNYPNDSVPISKFMNPATLTLGLGLDYKPNKKTSINFAPLSYKATYVLDTANIDQTKYGIPKNKRVLHEPGASLQITNEFSPFKSITITNRIQFFTNYIDKPQNVDVDWEMIATARINWFTEVRINTQMIYDDNVLISLVDRHGKPLLGTDGQQRKGKRLQFKELLGFSFVFKF